MFKIVVTIIVTIMLTGCGQPEIKDQPQQSSYNYDNVTYFEDAIVSSW